MGTNLEQRKEVKSPPDLTPLAKLGQQIRLTKYKPTAQETEVLQKCVEDGNSYNVNGIMLSSAVMWNLAGSGKKLKAFPRVIVTVVAGILGGRVGNLFAGKSCMRKILSLEASPLRGELIAILQEDYPNHPLLKGIHVQHGGFSHVDLVHEPEDYGPETRVTVSSKDLEMEMEMEVDDSNSRMWENILGREGGHGQNQNGRLPRIWETSRENQDVKKDFNGADFLADPFDLILQTGLSDDIDESNSDDLSLVEKRRSRMSAKERREYDRKQYEQRREQRSF